jgi:predicted metal-dependent phosphoesterase TrpH
MHDSTHTVNAHASAPLIDMHTHSSCSDGVQSPTELVQEAIDKKLQLMALTDHDTTEGIEEATLAAASSSLGLVPGIEVSSFWNGIDIHITGLGIDPLHPVMVQATTTMREERQERTSAILKKLMRCNLPDTLQQITHYFGREHLTRTHFARFLVTTGVCRTDQEAFDRYLGKGKPAFVRSNWASMEQAVSWITASGGIAAIAHPHHYRLTGAKLGRLLAEFKELGGEAMEVEPLGVLPDLRHQLLVQVKKQDLIAVWGSDYHGIDRPGCHLGRQVSLPEGIRSILDDTRVSRYQVSETDR